MRVEDDADVEMLAEGALDADFDVVEVDEDRDVETFLMGQNSSLCRVMRCECSGVLRGRQSAGSGWSGQPSFAAVERRGLHRGDVAVILLMPSRSGAGASACGQHDPGELAALQELASLAAAPGDFVFAVLMVCSPPRVVSTVSRSRSPVEAMKPSTRSSSAELDQDHAFARAGQVVHLVGLAQDAAGLGGRGDQDLAAGDPRRRRRLRPLGRPREAAARRACWARRSGSRLKRSA